MIIQTVLLASGAAMNAALEADRGYRNAFFVDLDVASRMAECNVTHEALGTRVKIPDSPAAVMTSEPLSRALRSWLLALAHLSQLV